MSKQLHGAATLFTVMPCEGGASSRHRRLLDPRFRGDDDLSPDRDRKIAAEARQCL
jgi:hypothetical protein